MHDGVLDSNPRTVCRGTWSTKPERDLRVVHECTIDNGVDVLFEIESGHVGDQAGLKSPRFDVANHDLRSCIARARFCVDGVFTGDGACWKAILRSRQRSKPYSATFNENVTPTWCRTTGIDLDAIPRECVDLCIANG